eukprot:1155638-Pelagomonas_calceolata.AAC.1
MQTDTERAQQCRVLEDVQIPHQSYNSSQFDAACEQHLSLFASKSFGVFKIKETAGFLLMPHYHLLPLLPPRHVAR